MNEDITTFSADLAQFASDHWSAFEQFMTELGYDPDVLESLLKAVRKADGRS